jgi:hypothetical protein
LVLLMREGFFKYAVEMASGGMVYVPSLKTIGSGIRVILVPQQFERLESWYNWWEGFMIYASEMASVVLYIHTTFHKDWYRRSSNIKIFSQRYEYVKLRWWCYQGRDLWSTPLKWTEVAWYTYEVPWWSVQAFK